MQRLVDEARGAEQLLARGRHAAGERSLRAIAAALERRGAQAAAGTVVHQLASLLTERGRWQEAHAAFLRAHRMAAGAGHEALASECEAWAAWSLVSDGARPVAAAALRAGATRRGAIWRGVRASWWVAARESGRPCEGIEWVTPTAEGMMPATDWGHVMCRALLIRGLASAGYVFEAGREARAAWDSLPETLSPRLRVLLEVAHLAVLAATGDAALFEPAFRGVLARARLYHLPLALREARRVGEAMARRARQVGRPPTDTGAEAARAMVCASHGEADDAAAVVAVAEEAAKWLGTTGLMVFLGPSRDEQIPVATVGGRAADDGHAGERVGIHEGDQRLGELVCQWRQCSGGPGARACLDLVAAVMAPRLRGLCPSPSGTSSPMPELVGTSEAVQALRAAVARAAIVPFSVLIEGESGSGKELVARALHRLSRRSDRPFRDLNCAALPDDLVEAELFGHARGAYTGALAERSGLFEEASGGTLFLDELPDLSMRAQAKLLRVLQQREVRRLGETVSRPIDVRLVAATNRPLGLMAAEGRFRPDLLYRLDVVRVCVPPLRERPDDVAVLAQHFWQEAARQVGTRARLTPALLGRLAAYHWPGNVRQLQNVVSGLAVVAPVSGAIGENLLPPDLRRSTAVEMGVTVEPVQTLAEARRGFERQLIVRTLARAGGSRTRAAAQLGLSRQGLLKLMSRLRVPTSGPSTEPDVPAETR